MDTNKTLATIQLNLRTADNIATESTLLKYGAVDYGLLEDPKIRQKYLSEFMRVWESRHINLDELFKLTGKSTTESFNKSLKIRVSNELEHKKSRYRFHRLESEIIIDLKDIAHI